MPKQAEVGDEFQVPDFPRPIRLPRFKKQKQHKGISHPADSQQKKMVKKGYAVRARERDRNNVENPTKRQIKLQL
jgi:hypothetical protein